MWWIATLLCSQSLLFWLVVHPKWSEQTAAAVYDYLALSCLVTGQLGRCLCCSPVWVRMWREEKENPAPSPVYITCHIIHSIFFGSSSSSSSVAVFQRFELTCRCSRRAAPHWSVSSLQLTAVSLESRRRSCESLLTKNGKSGAARGFRMDAQTGRQAGRQAQCQQTRASTQLPQLALFQCLHSTNGKINIWLLQ